VEGIVDGNHSVRILELQDVENASAGSIVWTRLAPNGRFGPALSAGSRTPAARNILHSVRNHFRPDFSCGFPEYPCGAQCRTSLNIGIFRATRRPASHAWDQPMQGSATVHNGGTGGQDLGPGRATSATKSAANSPRSLRKPNGLDGATGPAPGAPRFSAGHVKAQRKSAPGCTGPSCPPSPQCEPGRGVSASRCSWATRAVEQTGTTGLAQVGADGTESEPIILPDGVPSPFVSALYFLAVRRLPAATTKRQGL